MQIHECLRKKGEEESKPHSPPSRKSIEWPKIPGGARIIIRGHQDEVKKNLSNGRENLSSHIN